jgi:hypothetical protein
VAVIEGENYRVDYAPERSTIQIIGVLRLSGLAEYAPVTELLNQALNAHKTITLDLRQLEFLNSSGIGMLLKFVIEARNKQDVTLNLQGSGTVPWQAKSLVGLQRLMPGINLVIEPQGGRPLVETFGNYEDVKQLCRRDQECLSLSFSPSSISLKQRWRNNSLSADFLGDYFTVFFPKDENDPGKLKRQHEVRNAVSYIANELLENAMKFSDERLGHPVSMRLSLDHDRIIFSETNGVSRERAEQFRKFINKVLTEDTNDLYLRQMEENAMTDNSVGLGYLTMVNDYGAELGWRFEEVDPDGVVVTTEVKIVV